jgi:hypothetical protein
VLAGPPEHLHLPIINSGSESQDDSNTSGKDTDQSVSKESCHASTTDVEVLKDISMQNANTIDNARSMKLRSATRAQVLSLPCHTVDMKEKAKLLRIPAYKLTIPKSVKEAMKGEYAKFWQDAIDVEMSAHEKSGTWKILEDIPEGKYIQSKFVFDLKTDEEGYVVRFKVRLVARGDQQINGFDYFQTWAPTLRMESMRILLAIAANLDLEIVQIDFKTAFLNSALDIPIIMRLPNLPGTLKPIFVRIARSLYGLKQAGRLWNQDLHQSMLALGYIQNEIEPTIYQLRGHDNVFVGIYVDDTIIIAPRHLIKECKAKVMALYESTDEGEIHHILKLKVTRNRPERKITLSQGAYIEEILSDAEMLDCKELTSIQFTFADKHNTSPLDRKFSKYYSSMVGKAVWLSRATRPDIAHAVHLLSRHLAAPRRVDYLNLQKLLRYLKGTKDYVITLGGNHELQAFCDANYITPEDEQCKSISGYMFTIYGPVSWSVKLQSLIAQSSTESEHLAANLAGREARWITMLAESLGQIVKMTIRCDNQSTLKMIKNPTYHARQSISK